jgi:hypothetical protein
MGYKHRFNMLIDLGKTVDLWVKLAGTCGRLSNTPTFARLESRLGLRAGGIFSTAYGFSMSAVRTTEPVRNRASRIVNPHLKP